MAVYDLRGLGADFIIHYGGDDTQIDAFTFGNSLIAFGNALQAINREINPGYSLEVSVQALGRGSFRPKIKTKAKKLASLLATDFRSVIVQVLAAVIIARCTSGDSPPIIVHGDHVEYHSGGDVIILPKEAYEPYRRARENPDVNQPISQAFEILEEDEEVRSLGFARSQREKSDLPFEIGREQFSEVARPREALTDGQREVTVSATPLQVVRALFEDTSRRWQFVWRGIRISAPITDKDFRGRLVRGEISLTHGDVFIADLRIVQRADAAGIWVNESYEAIRIVGHLRREEQGDLLQP
jgi:hypothetical protein